MNLQPATVEELSEVLACAHTRGEKVQSVDLGKLNRLLEHKAEDMTATAEAGITLDALQKQLAQRGQWLPIDPPHAETLTIADLLATNVSGPRRFGYGTIGDYVIGLKAVLADGRVIQSGGKVVKNVAGYDLAKLFIGARGTLAIVAEVTFKLRPLPEVEKFVQKRCTSPEEADALIEAVSGSELIPVVVDLHNSPVMTVILGFAGTSDEVNWQLTKAGELGFSEPSSLQYEERFWSDGRPAQKESVLPSKLMETLNNVPPPFVARAGNGVIYHRGAAMGPESKLPMNLMERLKNEFDPKRILPELPLS